MILGGSALQLPAILKAKEMGLQVVVVDMNPTAVGFNVDGVHKEVISTIDTHAILDAAERLRIDGIMTLASDMPMQSVAHVGQELGLVSISIDTAIRATNKAYMRDTLREHNVPMPNYYRVRGIEAFITAVERASSFGSKCIVKPVDNSGSRGVVLLENDPDLKNAYEYATHYSRSGEIMVEEFVEGPEVSVETLAIDGHIHIIQITDKLTTGPPYFVEMGHSQPSQLNELTKQQISEIVIEANRAIGIQNGPSHTEIKVTKTGPKVIELGARLGGDCITTHLVPLSTGIDMVESSIKIALGEKPSMNPKWNKGAAIRYLNTGTGVVSDILGRTNAEAIPGVMQVSIVCDVGEYVGEIKSSLDRAGFVIAQAENAEKAVQIAEDGCSEIQIVF